jgi:hypothetical protein
VEADVTQRARLAAVLFGLVFALLGAQSARADDPTIYVHYTMNCTFTIVGDNGAPITVIPPGRYQVLVTSPIPFGEIDLSGAADPNLACGHSLSFRLTGPGVSLHTTLEDGDGTGEQFQAMFQVGSYVAQEDRRPTLRTVITVASGAASTALTPSGGSGTTQSGGSGTPTQSQPSKTTPVSTAGLRGTLNGNVSTSGKLTLLFKGKKVSSLKAGRYKVTVLDETGRTGFLIQRLGKHAVKVTGPAFLGRHTVTLTLNAGQWFFYSSPGKKSYFVVTT